MWYHAYMPAQMTIRGVPPDVTKQLRAMARERGTSINNIVIELLNKALGRSARRAALERYVTWTDADRAEFDATLAEQRKIDPDLWQ